jgi:hypothetical protein
MAVTTPWRSSGTATWRGRGSADEPRSVVLHLHLVYRDCRLCFESYRDCAGAQADLEKGSKLTSGVCAEDDVFRMKKGSTRVE